MTYEGNIRGIACDFLLLALRFQVAVMERCGYPRAHQQGNDDKINRDFFRWIAAEGRLGDLAQAVADATLRSQKRPMMTAAEIDKDLAVLDAFDAASAAYQAARDELDRAEEALRAAKDLVGARFGWHVVVSGFTPIEDKVSRQRAILLAMKEGGHG